MGHYNQNGFERKDDGGSNIADVMREIKGFGNDVKGLKDSMQKDLNEVRQIAEEAKKGDPDIELKLSKITDSVEAKHTALDELLSKTDGRLDDMETALGRMPTGSDGSADEAKAIEDAIRFMEVKKAAQGSLAWADRPNADTVDIDGYKAWEQNFDAFLRSENFGRNGNEVEQKALVVGSNPKGGTFVPTAQSSRIIRQIFESNQMRQLATVENISTESLDVRVDRDEADCDWAGEETRTQETGTPDIGLQNIPVHELRARPKISQQMLEDAAIDVEGWLADKVADKMGRKEATAFIIGDGVKKPRGILTYPGGDAGARGTIKRFSSGAATAITSDAVVALPYQLKTNYMAQGSWIMNRLTVLQVMLLKDADGQYLWRPSLAAGTPATLGGMAISLADEMPLVAAGALCMGFGDFRRGYTIVDRLGITTQRDPYTAKPFVEFYTRKRVGGDVVDFDAYALMQVGL